MIVDFKDTTIYVGIDVHDKSWELQFLTEHTVQRQIHLRPPGCGELEKLLHRLYPGGDYLCAYEAGYCGYWIQQDLEKRGIACKIVNPADIPSTQKDKDKKTDKHDCRRIAKFLRSGMLEGIYVPQYDELQVRSLVRYRYKCQQDQNKEKNRVRSHLKFYGYQIPWEQGVNNRYWSKRMMKCIELFAVKHGDIALELKLSKLEELRKAELLAVKKIRMISRSERYKESIDNLRSIRGIGLLTAMLIMTELVDIRRFKNIDHLASYVGLVPTIRSSGETHKELGLVKRCHKLLRTNLIQSAWSSIRYSPSLTLYYEQCCQRMKGQKAIVKVARKLLAQIRYVLLNETKLST